MDKYGFAYLRSAVLPVLLLLPVFVCMGQTGKSVPPANPHATNLSIADYDHLISYYRYLKPDSAAYLANKAIELAKKTNDDNGIAMILNQMGMMDDNVGRMDESRKKYLEALALYQHAGNKKGEATELVRLGVVENRKGNYDKATGYFLDALKASEECGSQFNKMESYLTLGEAYLGQKKYDTALNYLKQAEHINNLLPLSNLSFNIFGGIGEVYRNQGKYDAAKAYFEKGIALSNKPQYQGLNITLTNNLALVYAMQGFKAKSIALQKVALAKAIQIKNYLRTLQTLTGLADSYGKDNPAQAIAYLKQALDLVKEKEAKRDQVNLLGRMADLYHYQHNDAMAYAVKQQQYAIADEYFYQKMAKQISSLQSAYELNEAKAKLLGLKYENNRERLKQRIIMSIAVGMVLLLCLTAMFYLRTRRFNHLLNSANRELQESNTVKDKLFSVLAHDLRSPLASIINLLSLIKSDDLDETERKEFIDMAMASSNASLDILNNLLKWGEMQIKGIRLKSVELWPNKVIDRNVAMLSALAELKGISVFNLVENNFKIVADGDHFEFVIRNLLSNAIKFTAPGGSVRISAEVNAIAGEVKFSVKDTGVGIKPERLERVFSMGNESTNGTNDEKGTSLGLVLCKEFIEANGGRIWVESVPDQGSEFMFVLRIA